MDEITGGLEGFDHSSIGPEYQFRRRIGTQELMKSILIGSFDNTKGTSGCIKGGSGPDCAFKYNTDQTPILVFDEAAWTRNMINCP
jgi:hypothetical protein